MKSVLRIILLYILEFLHFLIVIPFLTLVALSVVIVVTLAVPDLILVLILAQIKKFMRNLGYFYYTS